MLHKIMYKCFSGKESTIELFLRNMEKLIKKSKFCIELQIEWYLEKEKFLVSSESPKKQNKTQQTNKRNFLPWKYDIKQHSYATLEYI